MNEQISNYIWIFLISMFPVIELRGAIPAAIGYNIDPIIAYFICVLGNMLPVPFIILFIRPIFKYLKKLRQLQNLIKRLEEKAFKKSERILKYSFWGLALFVAIPLPGTGAWTGALIAALLDMRFKIALPAIFLGVVIAGILVTLIATGAFAGLGVLKEVLIEKY